eukprot:6665651-Alexandrium_andersonii.AAC.1
MVLEAPRHGAALPHEELEGAPRHVLPRVPWPLADRGLACSGDGRVLALIPQVRQRLVLRATPAALVVHQAGR